MTLVLVALSSSMSFFAATPALRSAQPAARQCIAMKKAPEERPQERPEPTVDEGSIIEFHDPAHGHHAAEPVLGIVQGVEYKAKGGARYQIVDASGSMHAVAEKAVHINLGSYKGKLKEPSDILKEYQGIMATRPTELGVE